MQQYIRMSGLGGQGVVTAAHILGGAAVKEGKNATVNPFFGAEKRLAPAESYVRIAEEEIYDTGEILYPHVIMVYHSDVVTKGKSYTMPFFAGLRAGGVIMVNSEQPLEFDEDDRRTLEDLGAFVHFLPATAIAKEHGGTELSTNIAMLGGLLGLTGVVGGRAMEESLKERFGGKAKFVASGTTAVLDDAIRKQYDKVEKLVSANLRVLTAAYEVARGMRESAPRGVR
ncbi:2-oxoacid:acceptor oxidoreductase family protein [Thioalkalicoccus limnaeus]|uniref:2-oxoacid:acceptor oxidoreductase family protein n=1 Tax=Thioalkalicoccus limnaeus TaxID=120681 RepID=A0ABV4BGK1_9GAMM